jgi:hypothetical protein
MPKVEFEKVKQDLARELVETHGWPEPLAEAAVDDLPHRGALRLNSGDLITFTSAVPASRNEWVKVDAVGPSPIEIVGHSVAVRVSAIVWCVGHDRP